MLEPIALTPRQQEVLECIRRHIADRGRPPSVREIMRRFGFRSLNGVTCHLRALERKGYLVRDPQVARGLRLTDQAVGVRVAGQVHAGPLSMAIATEDVTLHQLAGCPALVRLFHRGARGTGAGWVLLIPADAHDS